MKYSVLQLLLPSLVLVLVSCAAPNQNRYAYEEMSSCPTSMTQDQHLSGVVRCRAMCSSVARNFADYDSQCRCICATPGTPNGGYRAKPKPVEPPWSSSQTMYTPGQ